jgi:hypothetical protein
MNRLVLLPIDPYSLYVYWDLAAGVPPATGARPVLRLYESAPKGKVSRPFDIDVDLGKGHANVHLWSAGRRYHADLGLRRPDGVLLVLAQSNRVRTSSASPAGAEAPEEVEEPAPVFTSVPAPAPVAMPVIHIPFTRRPEPVRYSDLTEYTEERFVPGLPSSPGGAHDG